MVNEPSVYNRPKKLFVVSDIEGNFQAFCKLLLKGSVIDKYLQWTFGENHLVIVGDCFDRGEQVTECLWLIYSLEEKARKQGGYVHFILGNHEIMNLNGDWRYVHPRYAEVTRSPESHTALYDGNSELWRWLQTKNIIEKIGDILFVHGGISAELLNFNLSVADINNQVRPFYAHANAFFSDPLLTVIFNQETSPFWYRGYYQPETSEDLIDNTLTKFKVNCIITGHTITDSIQCYFNNKVINIDTDHTAENSEALLIISNRYYRVRKKGGKERLK